MAKSKIAEIGDKISKRLGRKLTQKEWSSLGGMVKRYDAALVGMAVDKFYMMQKDLDDDSNVIGYIFGICKSIIIKDEDPTPNGDDIMDGMYKSL